MAFLVHTPEISKASVKIFLDPGPSPNAGNSSLRRLSILGHKEKSATGLKANVRVEDRGIGISALDQNLRLYGRFSASVKGGLKKSKEDEEKQDFHLNMGYAIRTVREEFPEIFYRELSFDIYRDDVVFKDPLNTFVGIENYKLIFWALRLHGRLFFRALWLDIIRVWQPAENIVMVRWTIHGIPRVPWETRGRFDGTSEYKFDRNGKIYEHRVDNIALNSPPKFQMLTVQDLIQSIGCPSTPKPTYFETSRVSSEES